MVDKCFDNSCCRAFWTGAEDFASSRGSGRHRAVPPWAIEQLGACSPLHESVYPICATCPNESWLSGKRKQKKSKVIVWCWKSFSRRFVYCSLCVLALCLEIVKAFTLIMKCRKINFSMCVLNAESLQLKNNIFSVIKVVVTRLRTKYNPTLCDVE